ncbi:MAG: GPR endopeptidase [Clostridiales bacterium]|nr:GPR endopeptidase [Clostridiales bacterium]
MGYKCHICGGSITSDERGLNLKLINRGMEDGDLLCIACLGEKFRLTEEDLRKMIMRFRRSGCTLFSPLAQEEEYEI